MTKNIKVLQNNENEVPYEIMAQEIVAISNAMKSLSNSRLSRAAIVALIHDRSKLGKTVIEIVLNNLDNLEKNWLKPKVRP